MLFILILDLYAFIFEVGILSENFGIKYLFMFSIFLANSISLISNYFEFIDIRKGRE